MCGTYTHAKTGDRLHAREVDYTVCADYYKGDPNGGYRSFVFTDHLSAERLVEMRDMVERDVREKLNIPFNPVHPRCVMSIQWDRVYRASSIGSAGKARPAHQNMRVWRDADSSCRSTGPYDACSPRKAALLRSHVPQIR